MDCLGSLWCNLCKKLCFGVYEPKMAMEFGSAKKNRCWMSGLPTDSPLALFWDCKNSPSLYELDQKRPCVVCLKLFEVNGLSWLIK